MNYEFKEFSQQWEIDKWNRLFRKAYDGHVAAYSGDIRRKLSLPSSKYIRVDLEGAAIGYSRLTLRRKSISDNDFNETWSIEEILILNEFRHKGAASSLIAYLRDSYDISHINIQRERAEKLKDFHSLLDLGLMIPHPTTDDMTYVINTRRLRMAYETRLRVENDNEKDKRVA